MHVELAIDIRGRVMYEVSLLSMMANNGSKTNTCGFEFLTNQSSVGEEWSAKLEFPIPCTE